MYVKNSEKTNFAKFYTNNKCLCLTNSDKFSWKTYRMY